MTKSISTKKRVAAKTRSKDTVATMPMTDEQRQLAMNHIPFAEHMSEHYFALGRSKGIRKEELLQDARFALCEAALRYKALPCFDKLSTGETSPEGEGDLNASFQTYAYKWCLKYIMMSINRKDIGTGEDIDTLEDDVPEEDGEAQKERQLKVEAMMAVLNDQEAKVVRLLYGFGLESSPQVGCEPKDFKEIAVMMHLHVGRVHQIYEKARTKMEFGLSPALPHRGFCRRAKCRVVNPLNF